MRRKQLAAIYYPTDKIIVLLNFRAKFTFKDGLFLAGIFNGWDLALGTSQKRIDWHYLLKLPVVVVSDDKVGANGVSKCGSNTLERNSKLVSTI